MKKRFISLLLVVCMFLSLATVANARASEYLDGYVLDPIALGNGEIELYVRVEAVYDVDRVGIMLLQIEERNSPTSSWHSYDTLWGSDDPDKFYDYNFAYYTGIFVFDLTPGRDYRFTITAYAGDTTGFDTRVISTGAITCK